MCVFIDLNLLSNFGSSKMLKACILGRFSKKKRKKQNTTQAADSLLHFTSMWQLLSLRGSRFTSFQGTSFNSAVCNLHLARAVEPGNGRLDLEPSELTAQTREVYQISSQIEPQIQISCHHHGLAVRW